MGPNRELYILTCLTLLIRVIKSYEDSICDEPNPRIYCGCDTKFRDTSVTCFITQQLNAHDDIWRSLGKVENLVNLKLNSMSQDQRLEYIPTESLQQMGSLRTFTVQQANLGALKSMAISELLEVRELQLEGNDITSLEKNAISNLPKLKKLSLSENLLQEVLADSIKEAGELEMLFLNNNNISRIEGCAFCDLHNLRDLELFSNRITDLTEYMFIGLRYLRRLDLYKNQIRILNDKVFQSMPKLVELDLSDNLISHVGHRAFFGLVNLHKLMLNYNKIKTLPDAVFEGLPTLRNVDLYYNELESLQEEVVENMANVKEQHFSLAFKENPLVCDCRLQWVKTYLKVNKSHHFTIELKDVKCRTATADAGNVTTLKIVHLMQIDCSSTEDDKVGPLPTSLSTEHNIDQIPTSRSIVQKQSSLVPYSIQKGNKTASTVIAEEMPVVQEAEVKSGDEMENEENGPSTGVKLVVDLKLMVLVSLLTFLVRNGGGTL